MQLAFVLLGAPTALDAPRIAGSLNATWPAGAAPLPRQDDEDGTVLAFTLGGRDTLYVAPMPAAVPAGEAEEGVQFSLSALGTGWVLPPHQAHVIVSVTEDESTPAIERVARFTRLVAGLIDGLDGVVGVYWGAAGATHAPDFFREVALDESVLPLVLVTGLSLAHVEGRVSFLSLGMAQLGLPNLMLSAPPDAADAALGFFFDILAYVVERGEPLPDGDTVGRTAEEHLTVRYAPSPVEPGEQVWCLDLP